MNKQTEAERLADCLETHHRLASPNEEAAAELRRLVSFNKDLIEEVERLNKALTWEQNRAGRIGTHGPGCHTWGPAHFECLLREHERLKASIALDKKAENARELGLSYDDNFCDKNCVWTDHHPDCKAVQELWVGLSEEEINKLRHLVDWTAEWSYGRFAYELERLLREKNARPQPAAPEFYHHVVENEGDWSEWVNPDNDSYMMKCCDCGLVHEMQFKVAKYSDGDECEFVGDPDLQPVFRARRAEEAWQETDTPPAAQPVPVKTYHDGKAWPVAPKPWVNLTDEEMEDLWAIHSGLPLYRAIEAKLKEKNHD
jgi:hypothetical protein